MSKTEGKTRKKRPAGKLMKQSQLDTQQQQVKIQSPKMRLFEANRILCGKLLPDKFKFRENQVKQIQNTIKTLINNKKANVCKIIMITGSPGAGKTMCTNNVLQKLEQQDYKIISLNSNMLKKRHDIQTILAEQLLGVQYLKQEQKNLTTFKIINQLQRQKSKIKKCILYIQEVELFLNSHKQLITQSFFDIFTNRNLKIVLLGISNTIDALQRYGQKLNVKVKDIVNIVFNPYTVEQLKQIILQKIEQVQKDTGIIIKIDQKMAKYIANKVNQLKKGDMRKVFQFLKQLSHGLFQSLNEQNSQKQPPLQYQVTIQQVKKSFMSTSGTSQKSRLILNLPFQTQVVLIAIYCFLTQQQQVSVTEHQLLRKICHVYDGIGVQPRKDIVRQIQYLTNYGLVEQKIKAERPGKTDSKSTLGACKNIKRYLLKISTNDIKSSLEDHPVFGRFV